MTGSAELEQIEIAGYYFHGLEIDMVEAFKENMKMGLSGSMALYVS